MPKKVAVIDMVFSIQGRGTVIALPKEENWHLSPGEALHRRERIQIRMKNGRLLRTFIKDIDLITRGRDEGSVGLVLPRSARREDIEDGSELWLERAGTQPLLEPR